MSDQIASVTTEQNGAVLGWYHELSGKERRTFWACFVGWALDAMDVQIFSFVIPSIVVAFTITNADAGFIGTVTLLTSALGGWPLPAPASTRSIESTRSSLPASIRAISAICSARSSPNIGPTSVLVKKSPSRPERRGARA